MLRVQRSTTLRAPVLARVVRLASTNRSRDAEFTPAELSNRVKNAPLLRLVGSYRKHGHRAASLDPLGLAQRPPVPALDPRRYGFACSSSSVEPNFASETLPAPFTSQGDRFDVSGILDFPGDSSSGKTIEEIARRLKETYSSGVGIEFMHLPDKRTRRFLERTLEGENTVSLSTAEQLANYELLARSEVFDQWAAKRFPLVKRYGLEGGEALMVCLKVAFDSAASNGVEDVVLAIPHRGRLNVLTQLLDLDMRLLVRKMRGLPTLPLPSSDFGDDVLSHLFTTSQMPSSSASRSMNVHLLPNPSHLEAVTPVAMGLARGLQTPFGPEGTKPGDKVLSLSVHGDAAFAGQGVVYESLNMSSLPHFDVGGTVRFVVNNQMGYTTPFDRERGKTLYATDLAKSIAAPIIHVNADNIEDVHRATLLACAYQRVFRKDVVLDLVTYRRRGHNELDEPSYTSPRMYRTVRALPSVLNIYEKQLVELGTLSTEHAELFKKAHFQLLDRSLVAAEPQNFSLPALLQPRGWDRMRWPSHGEWAERIATGVAAETLKEIGRRSVEVPDDFAIHPKLVKTHVARRLASLELGTFTIDFATAETLSLGSLMLEGKHVRLCGQDSARGTFAQRHATFVDQESESVVTPLHSLTSSPPASVSGTSVGTFEVVNSPLTEYSIWGFEQGLSYVSPDMLPLVEAQFGDFANTAQVAIDTFFVSGESKWGLASALTYLLPHGYDNAGPEHSSARPERFLQMSNEPLSRTEAFAPNFHLVNVTTAASYFHVLRRQLVREYRKPLVILSPKGILRLPAASASMQELTEGTSFASVLDDPSLKTPADVEQVVLLSGKMYYDLVKARSESGMDGRIVFIRLEEVTPFPYDALESILARYSHATSVVWAQEEPENAGAWAFVQPRLAQLVPRVSYIGRRAMSQVAPGVSESFQAQRAEILEKVFNL